jgi:hypothetical protein
MGRARVIQGEVQKRLLEALGKGAPIRIACGYAGVHADTYFEECKRNPDFADRATRARHGRAVRSLDEIWKAGNTMDWRAHAKYLELTFPDEFNRQRVELQQGEPLRITLDFGSAAPVSEPDASASSGPGGGSEG